MEKKTLQNTVIADALALVKPKSDPHNNYPATRCDLV